LEMIRGNLNLLPTGERYLYDGENRQVVYCPGFVSEADCSNPAVMLGKTFYYYDGEGRRVGKVNGAVTQVFVYDARGQLAAEYGGSPEVTGTHYVTADHLGTTRVITDSSKAVLQCRDYLPFGDELLATSQNGRSGIACYSGETGLRQKFTGKERDAESRLDYFGARYYSWAAGRFTSPDKPFADQDADNPQSWNLYTYVRNNPLRYLDPTGEGVVSAAVKAAFGAARRQSVREAWKHEREMVIKLGEGTYEWTKAQKRELIERGRVSGFEAHHINSVKGHDLGMAGNPNNITFVEGRAGQLEAHGGNFRNETSGPLIDRLSKLGGAGLVAFFATFDQKMNEFASQSPLISNPDSWWSMVNPFNYLVENAALVEAFAAADAADRAEAKREEEERKRREE
jgi:RHS repeat-associated protein